MPRIFISYRRSDELDRVSRMRDKLGLVFGDQVVFRDEEGIVPGAEFPEVIREAVENCRVLVVAIGPGWVDAVDADGERRLPQPGDWVRQEIEIGLSSRHVDAVIPVLLNGAAFPTPEQLPPSIQALLSKNGLTITDKDINDKVPKLVAAIEHWGVPRQEVLSRSNLVLKALCAAAVLAVVVFGLTRIDRSDPSRDEVAAPAAPASSGGTPTKPTPMRGDFNVAVAEFTATDPDDADEASLLAARLAKRLQDQLASQAGADVEVRGPEDVGALVGASPAERQESVERLARELGADVVIGGQVSFAGPSTIVPSAFLNPERLADHPELGGLYELDPIAARGSYTNAVTKDSLLSGLLRTTEAMGSFIGGVSYYGVLDDDASYPGLAEERFRAVLASPVLPASTEEGAHAFLGSLALIRRDLAQAEEEYTAATTVNPRSVRGRLGLAEVRHLRSSGVRCAPGTVDLKGLADAGAAFGEVAGESLDAGSDVKARLGAARVQRCRAQAGAEVDEAEVQRSLRAVIALAGEQEPMRELAAAAHAELALALAPPAGAPDEGALRQALAESELAAQRSLRPADRAVYLWQQAGFAAQLGDADGARRALAAAADDDPSFGVVTVAMLVPQTSGRSVPSGVGAPPNARTSTPLAATGGDHAPLALLGVALLALGAALVAAGRRQSPARSGSTGG